jgi:aldose 1-epimerase
MNATIQTDRIKQNDFGTHQNKAVYLYTLKNKNGHQISISNFGGIITKWLAPDKNGQVDNIVVGLTSLADYLKHPNYHFGGIIGRYANRIAKGKFNINTTAYQLEINDAPNHIHGGHIGFDQVVWDAEIIEKEQSVLLLKYLSKDGEEGFPGNLYLEIEYSLSDENELKISYKAETDKTTPINLTNHSYFNLSGNFNQTILSHQIQILADHYLKTNEFAIPTGELKSVNYTAFNLNAPTFINNNMSELPDGYDHNFVLNKPAYTYDLAAVLRDTKSGRKLEVYTTEPGMQLYTGNFLDGLVKNDQGISIQKHTALCIETQHYPDSPNHPLFPSTLLQPNETFNSCTVYKLILE